MNKKSKSKCKTPETPSCLTTDDKPGREVGHIFDEYDLFAQSVSSFNIEGKKQVGTCIGLSFSILIAMMVLAYAGIKGKEMMFKEKP